MVSTYHRYMGGHRFAKFICAVILLSLHFIFMSPLFISFFFSKTVDTLHYLKKSFRCQPPLGANYSRTSCALY